jgi:hypothetical protein
VAFGYHIKHKFLSICSKSSLDFQVVATWILSKHRGVSPQKWRAAGSLFEEGQMVYEEGLMVYLFPRAAANSRVES